MHIRRSLLFLNGAILLFFLGVISWLKFSSVTVFPWTGWTASKHSDLGIADGPLDLGNGWIDPKPNDDTLRKNPPGIDNVDVSDDISGLIRLRSHVLRERLKSLLESPELSHSQAVAKNEEACPRHIADIQVNQDQLRGNSERWLAVSASDIRSRRRAIIQHLEQLEKEGKTVMGLGSGAGEGRGVVMTAGNKVKLSLGVNSSVFIRYCLGDSEECPSHTSHSKAGIQFSPSCSNIFIPRGDRR